MGPYPLGIVVDLMHCPQCGESDTRVVDSRDYSRGVRRRRECVRCGARFTTLEQFQSRSLFVIKKDGRREDFSREKLLSGIRRACEKRPLRTGAIDKIVDDIESELYRLGKAEVPSSAIGDMVMERLRGLDYIAYIRFASVYREFADIGAFKREVDNLVEGKGEKPPTSQLPLLPGETVGPTVGTRRGRLAAGGRKVAG